MFVGQVDGVLWESGNGVLVGACRSAVVERRFRFQVTGSVRMGVEGLRRLIRSMLVWSDASWGHEEENGTYFQFL